MRKTPSLILLLIITLTVPTQPVRAQPEPNTISTIGDSIDWSQFWQTFKQYAIWDLEWYDGSDWVSVKDDMDVQLSYPEPNRCKVNLVFDASHAGNYRLTHAINRVVREYITKVDQYQYDLTYDDMQITFDWSDCADISGLQFSHGVKDGFFWFRIRRDNVPLGAHVEIDPATVATSTSFQAVQYGYMRKSFHAEGLFWVFYSDGTNAGWEFSNDGTTWVGAFTSIGASLGNYFSVWYDGTYVHYVRTDHVGTDDTYYRRGTPVNDGSINWSASEQLIYNGAGNNEYEYPCISVDTSGYAWIVAYHDQTDGDDFPIALKNANNDGTWALDFVTELSAVDNTHWRVVVIPLTSDKVYVIYCRYSQTPLGKLYDAGWGGEENDIADFNIEDDYGFSAVADGDNVHFVYNRDVSYEIRHNERVWGVGWNVSDVVVETPLQEDTVPALSHDTSANELYCFWTHNTPDHVFYKKYSGGAWDVAATDWIDESIDDIQDDYLISSYYQDYDDYIGLLYVTETGAPYKVRFAFLTMEAGGQEYSRLVSQSISFTSNTLGLISTTFTRTVSLTLSIASNVFSEWTHRLWKLLDIVVKTLAGEPIENAVISAWQLNGTENFGAITDSEGYIPTQNLTKGNYTILATKEGHLTNNTLLQFLQDKIVEIRLMSVEEGSNIETNPEVLGLFGLAIVMQMAYFFLLYTDRKPVLTFIIGPLTSVTWYTTGQTVLFLNQVHGVPIAYLLYLFSTLNIIPIFGIVYSIIAPKEE